MNKASPVAMRQALEVVEMYKQAGILFVPMPVFSEEERAARVHEADKRLDQVAKEMEGES